MCWMDFHNEILCCGFICARLISVCLSRLPRRGLPRPILTTTGYHACDYIPVITPVLSRSTTQVHRVITPAVSNSYFVVYLSPAFTPAVLLLLHHHRAPHVPTYSTYPTQPNHTWTAVFLCFILLSYTLPYNVLSLFACLSFATF